MTTRSLSSSTACPPPLRRTARASAPPPLAPFSICAATTAGTAQTPRTCFPAWPGTGNPVPPANAAAQFAHYADVTPFVIGSARQFNPEAPPALTSQLYTDDFNEVKASGGVTSTTRTADQTLVARLLAPIPTVTTTGIPAVWNNLTRDLIRARNLNDLEAARLLHVGT